MVSGNYHGPDLLNILLSATGTLVSASTISLVSATQGAVSGITHPWRASTQLKWRQQKCVLSTSVIPCLGQPGEGDTPEAAPKPLQGDLGHPTSAGHRQRRQNSGLLRTQPSVLEEGLPQANSKREDTLYILIQPNPNTQVLGNKMCVFRLSWSLFRILLPLFSYMCAFLYFIQVPGWFKIRIS